MRRTRFSLSNLSIRHQPPLLIGTLLFGIITASTWAAYRGVEDFNAIAERAFLFSTNDAIRQPLDRFVPERFRTVN